MLLWKNHLIKITISTTSFYISFQVSMLTSAGGQTFLFPDFLFSEKEHLSPLEVQPHFPIMYSSLLSTSVPANPISCSIHEAQQPGALAIAATLFPWPSHLLLPPRTLLPLFIICSPLLQTAVRCSLIPNLTYCL